jgi:signal transduction histidine kinase
LKRVPPERSALSAFGATVTTVLLLVWWTRELQVGWLIGALLTYGVALGIVIVTWRRRRRQPRALTFTLGVLLVALGCATAFSWEFQRIERSWDEVLAQRELEQGRRLREEMARLVNRGEDAAERASLYASREDGAQLFRSLELLQAETGVDAVAIYTDAGDLVAWSGDHRGSLPDSLWLNGGRVYFEERPLFSYLYFSSTVPNRGHRAISAVLVETSLLTDEEGTGLQDVAVARTQTPASFLRGSGPDAVWALVSEGDTVVHARLARVSQADWRQNMNGVTRAVVLFLVLLSYVTLVFGWVRLAAGSRGLAAVLPLLLLVPMVAVAPLYDERGSQGLFSPMLFALPFRDMTLGRLLVVLIPLAALVAGARRPPARAPAVFARIAIGAVVVAATYPLLMRVLLNTATSELYVNVPVYWIGLQLTAVLLLASLTLLLLPRSLPLELETRAGLTGARRRALLVASIMLCVLFGVYAAGRAGPGEDMRIMTASLWALPFAMSALALAPGTGRSGALTRWLMAGVLAATAVLPHLWVADVSARLAKAESELKSLGMSNAPENDDPFLDYLLISFGDEARARFAAGETGVQLLYRAWVGSELARHPYHVRIALWSPPPQPPSVAVQLGSAPPMSAADVAFVAAFVAGARGDTVEAPRSFHDMPSIRKLQIVPLSDGSVISVVVPPRRTFERTSAIGQFLGEIRASNTRLNLVATLDTDPQQDSVQWHRSRDGWRSEALVKYPEGWHHAHLSISLPNAMVRIARAVLLLTLDMLLLTLLWIFGVVARGGAAAPRGAWTGWFGSFRARVTVSLFAFFLVPTAIFGWTAYRALSDEVARASQTVAQHSAAQAVLEFEEALEAPQDSALLRDLAAHAGSDVLRYHRGELIEVSAHEALAMGIYSAWMPPAIFQQLESREEVEGLHTQQLGNNSYVIAYRVLRPAGALGVPMSLSAGDVPLRQRERAHLVLFTAVVGALLSLALSIPVGRALTRPIGLLSRAATAVGAGRLRVQLPERSRDEFGQLFAAFNRMTRRLRRARARELRTARVLAWGEMARQIAHEIKNPLTPIKLSVQHLRRARNDRHPQFDEILDTNVSQILIEIDRLSEIASAFSRYGAPALANEPLAAVDVGAVVHEALTLYRSADSNVRYAEEIEPGLPRVRARSNELKEVVLNLVENSRAALEDGGDIVVRAFTREDHVVIEVADNGVGIPPELVSRIFEPHFSTRSSGTGLGLAIVRRLVESWGGTVTAESDVDVGTIVRLRLDGADQFTAPGNSRS